MSPPNWPMVTMTHGGTRSYIPWILFLHGPERPPKQGGGTRQSARGQTLPKFKVALLLSSHGASQGPGLVLLPRLALFPLCLLPLFPCPHQLLSQSYMGACPESLHLSQTFF